MPLHTARCARAALEVASLLTLCLGAGAPAAEAQAPARLKVDISVDLEGIAGVVAASQTSPDGINYEWARRQMIAETNAAIEGAFAGGASEVGEYGLNAMVAGYFGVPVVFISGDRAAVDMARDFIPGIDGLAVKDGIRYSAARTMHPLEARERIAAGVRAALVKRIARQPVRLGNSITLEVELDNLAHADQMALIPGVRRSGRTVSYTSSDALAVYKVSRLMVALSRD